MNSQSKIDWNKECTDPFSRHLFCKYGPNEFTGARLLLFYDIVTKDYEKKWHQKLELSYVVMLVFYLLPTITIFHGREWCGVEPL